jgi:hypothetical protein
MASYVCDGVELADIGSFASLEQPFTISNAPDLGVLGRQTDLVSLNNC